MNTRIRLVDVFELRADLPEPFHWSTGTASYREAVLVSITTDSGISGWGEAINKETAGLIRDTLALELHDSDALDSGGLLPRLRAAVTKPGVAAAVAAEAVGAVEVALWDIAARAADRPVCALLAGVPRDRVDVYASSIYYSRANGRDDPAATASDWMRRGFYGVKIKVGGVTLVEDMARIEAVRRAIGPGVPLMVDANQVFDVGPAKELAAALVPFEVMWLEEPVASHDVAAHRALKQSAPIAIATGENLRRPQEFAPFIQERLVDFVQPNVARVGGLTAALEVAQMASQNGLCVAVHHWGTAIGLAASLHLACCVPESAPPPSVEVDCSPNPLRDIFQPDWCRPRQGKMAPSGPGLGVVPDVKVMAQYHVSKA